MLTLRMGNSWTTELLGVEWGVFYVLTVLLLQNFYLKKKENVPPSKRSEDSRYSRTLSNPTGWEPSAQSTSMPQPKRQLQPAAPNKPMCSHSRLPDLQVTYQLLLALRAAAQEGLTTRGARDKSLLSFRAHSSSAEFALGLPLIQLVGAYTWGSHHHRREKLGRTIAGLLQNTTVLRKQMLHRAGELGSCSDF